MNETTHHGNWDKRRPSCFVTFGSHKARVVIVYTPCMDLRVCFDVLARLFARLCHEPELPVNNTAAANGLFWLAT